MAVAEDHRPPGADVVDVALAVGVAEVRALGARDEARRAADGAEGAHRRVDAAGDDALGALEQRSLRRAAARRARRQWTWRGLGALRRLAGGLAPPSAAVFLAVPGSAQKKRSGTTLPMPGRKPASRRWSRKASASPTAACSSAPRGEQRGQRRRQRVAGADEAGLEALELLAGDRALRRRQHVVDELVGPGGTCR